jgi:hypothetical protein
MADTKEQEKGNIEENIAQNVQFTSIIPMLEELRRQKGPIDVLPGLPQSPRPPQQIKIENIMESCVFKSTLAGVLGKIIRHILFVFLSFSWLKSFINGGINSLIYRI